MDQTIAQIIEFVEENDIKFIRLQFCDIFGELKNISINSSELEKAFSHGISIDASSINGFLGIEDSDLFLVPDPSTLAILPWRPQEGRVARFFCYIKTPEGEIFDGDTRSLLKKTLDEFKKMDYVAKVGTECEFYLFKTDEEGEPTLIPQDKATYLDVAPLDKGENIRREVCLTVEEMGIKPESSHHESGNGQNEIDFKYDDALESADNLITLKTAVKTIASINGLYATFIPKPLAGKSGSGLHINMSLLKKGKNIFDSYNYHLDECKSFIAGILYRIKEITAILNPIVNSYKRFGEFESPKYITWSFKNRSQLIRIPASKGEYSRMEIRSPDGTCNPYLAITLLIKAGMEGIQQNRQLPEAVDKNLYLEPAYDDIELLPQTLEQALNNMEDSAFVKDALGEFIFDRFISMKRKEWEAYSIQESEYNDVSNYEINEYFYKL